MLPSCHCHLLHPQEMLVCRVALQREAEAQVSGASSADTTPVQHSGPLTASGDVAETRGLLKAALVPGDDYVRAEGPWH